MLKHSVLYQYKCAEKSCHVSYISFTTNTVLVLTGQHNCLISKIHQHFISGFQRKRIEYSQTLPRACIVQVISVFYASLSVRDIKVAKTILTREVFPLLNIQDIQQSRTKIVSRTEIESTCIIYVLSVSWKTTAVGGLKHQLMNKPAVIKECILFLSRGVLTKISKVNTWRTGKSNNLRENVSINDKQQVFHLISKYFSIIIIIK